MACPLTYPYRQTVRAQGTMILSKLVSCADVARCSTGSDRVAAINDEYLVKSGENLAIFAFSAEVNFHVVRWLSTVRTVVDEPK